LQKKAIKILTVAQFIRYCLKLARSEKYRPTVPKTRLNPARLDWRISSSVENAKFRSCIHFLQNVLSCVTTAVGNSAILLMQ